MAEPRRELFKRVVDSPPSPLLALVKVSTSPDIKADYRKGLGTVPNQKHGLEVDAKVGTQSLREIVFAATPFLVSLGETREVARVAGGSDVPAREPVTAKAVFVEKSVPVVITPWEEDFGWRVEQKFWSYFNRSEDPEGWNRRWIVEKDVPWEAVAREPLNKDAALMVESFFAVESFLPDFAEKGLGYYRSMVGLSNSHINWSYEELKHGRTLQLILERSGARTPEQTRDLRLDLSKSQWTMPYPTARQMLIYASFQEKETQRNYELLRGVLIKGGSLGAGAALRTIGRDEAFHHAFYKDMVKMLLEYDEVGTAQDIELVAKSFRMPAQHLMPNMEERVVVMVRNKVFGKKQVRDEAIIPTIKAFGFRDAAELASVASAKPRSGPEEIATVDPKHDAGDLEE